MNDLQQTIENQTSYTSLFKLLKSYRLAGGVNDKYSRDFNQLDTPAHLYFRIFFDFNTGLLDATNDLGTTPEIINDEGLNTHILQGATKINDAMRIHNSAINYLVLNNEWERADYLRSFINLLSNISTYSPWYFQTITGVDEAINRKEFVDANFSIGDETKGITIECLPDAYDSRIGTLMDLYRAACFSYHLHKEIVPANLRKFNMYLYIFSTGIRGIHSKTTVSQNISEKTEYISDASFDQHILPKKGEKYNGEQYVTSSKLIEFHECEFSYNSAATGYNTINDAEGFEQKYTIGISYKYAMEQRYNEILQRVIGDFILNDYDFKQQSYWNINDAADHNTVPVKDDRASTGYSDSILDSKNDNPNPMYGVNADYYESRKNDENLVNKSNPKKIFENPNKSSILDPWRRLIENRVGEVTRSVNQTINAGKSAIESWTDIDKLNQSLVTAVDKLTFGNLFTVNMTDIPNKATTFLGNINSRNVTQRMVNGWTRSET